MSVPRLIKEWPAKRQPILDEWAEVEAARAAARRDHASAAEAAVLADRISDLRRRYIQALPQVPVARDPFTNELVAVAMDTGGLDGPYWNAENPARPAETMPPTFVVLSGAMKLDERRLEPTPHLCLPGPNVPFVVPDLLQRQGVKAVVATVPIGPHTGYAITYFSESGPQPPPLPNEWGRREYWLRDAHGNPTTMDTSYDLDPAPDFDLLVWIQEGKLAWIAPGDPVLRLRWTLDRCPYVFPVGDHPHQRVAAR